MVHKYVYCVRGWLAFVAFIEFSNAIRCFIDEKQFLQTNLFTAKDEIVTHPMARILGRYCLLNGVIMTHCAVCIHHLPIISLSICSLSLSILLYGSEAFYYYTAAVNFYTLFPILVSVFTIICLLIAPVFLDDEPKRKKPIMYDEDEDDDYETMLIKQRTGQAQTASYTSPTTSKKIQ